MTADEINNGTPHHFSLDIHLLETMKNEDDTLSSVDSGFRCSHKISISKDVRVRLTRIGHLYRSGFLFDLRRYEVIRENFTSSEDFTRATSLEFRELHDLDDTFPHADLGFWQIIPRGVIPFFTAKLEYDNMGWKTDRPLLNNGIPMEPERRMEIFTGIFRSGRAQLQLGVTALSKYFSDNDIIISKFGDHDPPVPSDRLMPDENGPPRLVRIPKPE